MTSQVAGLVVVLRSRLYDEICQTSFGCNFFSTKVSKDKMMRKHEKGGNLKPEKNNAKTHKHV